MLLQADIDLCRSAFHKIDSKDKGYLEPVELRMLYEELGLSSITDMDVLDMIRSANLDEGSVLTFEDFVSIVELHGKPVSSKEDKEADTLLAFASMGGSLDGNGKIDVGRLTKTCQDFGLTIDIDSLLKDVDVDGDGLVGYTEFRHILTSPTKKDFKTANGQIPPEHSLLAALRRGRGGSFLPGHAEDPIEPESP